MEQKHLPKIALTHHEIAPFPEHLCDVVGGVEDGADSFNSP